MVGEDDDDSNRKTPKRPEEFAPSGAPGDDPLTRNLKKVYAPILSEPVPADILRLLDQLDGPPKKKGDSNV